MEKLQLTLTMLVFGTIGIFVRYIPIPSSLVAMARGTVGALFLIVMAVLTKRRLSFSSMKKNFWLLAVAGVFTGMDWILLFESYHYTTVAVATLCYYLSPVFVMIMSPVILKEKLTKKKVVCIFAALAGMVFVSGILSGDGAEGTEAMGIILGIGAAVLYAGVILLNKFLQEKASYEATIVQLGAAALILIPYTLLTEDYGAISWTGSIVGLLLTVGILHTGLAYWMYYSAIKKLPGQTVALLSYIDPAVAILLSMFFLGEEMDIWGLAGAVLILGSALLGELGNNNKNL